MLQLFAFAFTMGAVGSFHCVGMCGPLALALPISGSSFLARVGGTFVYNAGRIATYSVMGLLLGLIGKTAAVFGIQQWLSLVAGALILLFIIFPKLSKRQGKVTGMSIQLVSFLRLKLGGLLNSRRQSSVFIIGLLNGFLPCGLVYMAIAGALAAGSVGNSMFFMAAFGLGTLPVMWSIAFFGNSIGLALRQKIRRLYPYMAGVMACLLILRGLGLGIPYVSPKWDSGKTVMVECAAKPDETQEMK